MPSHIRILNPNNIPNVETIRVSLEPILRLRLMELCSNGSELQNLSAALLEFPPFARTSTQPEASNDDNIHDEYFRVSRIHGNTSEIFLHTIVEARCILLQDARESFFTIDAHKLNLLDNALRAALAWILNESTPASTCVTSWQSTAVACHSMKRWIRGHQVFAALTQCLIVAFRSLKQAIQQQDENFVESSVDLAVKLLEGSGAALEFTGDFPASEYNDVIRPSMTPPLVPETFSGLLSTDHRFFVQLLREMKPQMEFLHATNPGHHNRIAAAVANVYNSHQFVCKRLVGKSPSLMMASGSTKSGAEQIEKFKHLRLKVFEHNH